MSERIFAPRLDVTAANGVPFRVVLWADGTCGNNPHRSYDGKPLVDFYDASCDFSEHGHGDDGQFVAGYFLSTLEKRPPMGLNLMDHEADWSIDAATMTLVMAWLANVRPT